MQEIMKKQGVPSMTEVFRSAISALYEKTFKYGEDPLNNVSESDTPEIMAKKAKQKAEMKRLELEAEENAKLAPKIELCLSGFAGQIETNENGHKFCRFNQYTLTEDHSMMIPLKAVHESIIENNVFMPDRETVYKKRPEVKKLFEKLEKK